jgi:hydrogenase maturation protease
MTKMAFAERIILVAGLGNELLSDDGVGVHACRLLQEQARAKGRTDLVIAEIGTAVGDALHLFERAERILGIDAMQAGGAPGTIYLAGAEELADETLVGLHQLSLLGALQMIEAEMSGLPGVRWQRPQVEILGVEPASLALGMALSAPVQASLAAVADQAWQQIDDRTNDGADRLCRGDGCGDPLTGRTRE